MFRDVAEKSTTAFVIIIIERGVYTVLRNEVLTRSNI
jgi:hypothetical protein